MSILDKPEGRAKGGVARAERLSAERRSEIASKAATSRWQRVQNSLVATYGSPDKPLRIGAAELGCYVLSDSTRVLARVGFLRAIGRTGKAKGGREYDDALQTPVFLTAENLKPFLSAELLDNAKPIIFSANGAQMIGYRAELL